MLFEHNGRKATLPRIDRVFEPQYKQINVLLQGTDRLKEFDLLRLRYDDDDTYFYCLKNDLKPLDEEASIFLVSYKLGLEPQ